MEKVDDSCPDHIVVRFTNGSVIFASYVAPIDSPYFDPAYFSHISNVFFPINDENIFLAAVT